MAWVFNPFTGTLDQTGSGGGTPGGSDTQIQFNDGGTTFGGDADLTWNKTTNVMTVTGDVNLSDGGTYTTTLQTITPTANRTVSIPDATGTLALVAGSTGQPIYNNAGAYAGLSTATIGATGNITLSLNGAASTPPVSFTGTWFTGGTGTTTKPQLLIEPTGTTSTAWSTSGTGIGVNAASGFGGNLLDLQVNGTSRFSVESTGQVLFSAGGHKFYSDANAIVLTNSTGTRSFLTRSDFSIIPLTAQLKWGNLASFSSDTGLARDSAGVIIVTNGSTGTGYIKQVPVLVSQLPAAATVGAGTRGFVSDATSTTFAAAPVGGGANTVPVYSDGTNWLIG